MVECQHYNSCLSSTCRHHYHPILDMGHQRTMPSIGRSRSDLVLGWQSNYLSMMICKRFFKWNLGVTNRRQWMIYLKLLKTEYVRGNQSWGNYPILGPWLRMDWNK